MKSSITIFLFFMFFCINGQESIEFQDDSLRFDNVMVKFKKPVGWKFKEHRLNFFLYETENQSIRIYMDCFFNKETRTNEQIKQSVDESTDDYGLVDYYFEVNNIPVVKTKSLYDKKSVKKDTYTIMHLERNMFFVGSTHVLVGLMTSTKQSYKNIKQFEKDIEPIMEEFLNSFKINIE